MNPGGSPASDSGHHAADREHLTQRPRPLRIGLCALACLVGACYGTATAYAATPGPPQRKREAELRIERTIDAPRTRVLRAERPDRIGQGTSWSALKCRLR